MGKKQDRYEQSIEAHFSSTARTMTKANSTTKSWRTAGARVGDLGAILDEEIRRVGQDLDLVDDLTGVYCIQQSRLHSTGAEPPHSHVAVGTDAFWILEQRQSSRWAGQYGSWVPLGGVFYHVGSCFDTREGSGSGAVGRAEGGVSSSIVTLSSERESQLACQSVNWGCAPVTVMSSQPSRGEKTRDGSSLSSQSHTKWWCQPSSGRPPTPKQFDGHDVSLRFSITHGFTYPVAAVVAVVATIVMGQGWTGENFSWGARVHEPEVGCWTWGGRFHQRQPVSPSARPLPPAVLLPCGRMCQAGQRRHGVAWRGHGKLSGPLLCSPCLLSVSSSWIIRTC